MDPKATDSVEDVLHETAQGVFGLEEVVSDFDESDLKRLRELASVVRTPERGGLTSAIALAGSAAQSKFQLFPGDCDFFERVHIKAPSKEAAKKALVQSMVETIASAFPHPDLQFTEMLFGLHDADHRKGERAFKSGTPISWSLSDIDARSMVVEDADGNAISLELVKVAENPGFVKLDWVHADSEKDRIVAVTKVIDATWEAPDGAIVPLDGVVDSFYQEVYLDPDSKEHVERLIDQVRPAGLSDYIAQLEKEIAKYTAPGHENYGKVAKRLYNIFRITGHSGPALFLRELFDDPAARLYQVPGALHALEPVWDKHRLDPKAVAEMVDNMAEIVRACYTASDVDEIVAGLKSLPEVDDSERVRLAEDLSERVNAEVSRYFQTRLEEDPAIAGYLADLAD